MSTKKFFSKVTEPIDQWLELQGLYRKHTAHDPSCLFRAVAEQVYFSQCCHEIVRTRCVSFIAQNKDQYEKMIDGPMENYLSKLRSPKEWGSKLELNALSLLYQREIIVFEQGEKPTRVSINNVFGKCIMLCSSSDNHYDSVYPKSYITKAAFCQSVVYGVLYKRVFGLVDVDFAVDKMLHKSNHKREHYVQQNYICASRSMGLPVELPMKTIRHLEPDRFEEELNVKELLSIGITPFPYKVAKALDPDIYRNIEFDVWSDLRREMKLGIFGGNSDELQIGVKCLVKMHPDHHFHAHIQEMEPDNGPVIVFVEELGKMCTVSHDVLEPLPKNQKVQWSVPYKLQRHLTALSPKSHFLTLTELNSKWRKNKYNKSRKLKDLFLPASLSSNSTSHPSSFHQEPSVASIQYPMDHFNYNSNDSVASSEECSNESSQMMQSDTAVAAGSLVAPSADSTSSPTSAAPLGDSDQTLNNNCSPPLQIVGVPMYHSFCPESSGVRVSPSPGPPMPSYVLCSGNTQGRLHPVAATVDNFTMQPVNFYAQKSVHVNGSDLPFSDIPSLRFYYNLGHDHFRSCVMWPSSGSSCSSPLSTPAGENNSPLLPDSTVPSEDDSCHVQKTVQTVPTLSNQHTMRHGVPHAVAHSVPMTAQVVPQVPSQVTATGILPSILPQVVPVSPSIQHPVSHPPQKLLQQPVPSPQHAVCSVIPQSPSLPVQQPVFGVNNTWQSQPATYHNSPQRVHQSDCDSRSNSHSSPEDGCSRGTDGKNINPCHASVAVHPTVTDSFTHSQIFPYYVVEMDSVPYYNPYSYVMQQSSDIEITNSVTNVQMHTLQPQNLASMSPVLYHSQSVSHGAPIPHWISSDGVPQYAVTM